MGTAISQELNLLVVTWTAFPPTSGSGVIVSNLLSQFDKAKVVLAGEHTFGADIEHYDKPKYPFYLLKHPFHTGFRGSKYFKWLALSSVVRQLEKIIAEHQIEVVFGVFPDEFYTYAACKAAQNKKLPFFSWFHNTYLDNRTGILKKIAQWVQPKIFDYSRRIFTMSQGMNDFFQEQYPEYSDKMSALLHGFDIPETTNEVDVSIKGTVKFLLTGNINHSNRDSTERLAKAVLQHDPKNELHIYGGNSKSEWEAMGIQGDQVFLHGFVPLKELVNRFPEYDIMLLPHGFEGEFSEAEYRTIFPTRTIPLLYSGKPILAHSPPDTAITKMLKNTKSALVVEERDFFRLKESINRLLSEQDTRKQLIYNALKAADNYNVRTIADQLKTILFL